MKCQVARDWDHYKRRGPRPEEVMQRPRFDEGRHTRKEAHRVSAFVIDTGNTKEMPSGLLPWSLCAAPALWPASWPSP